MRIGRTLVRRGNDKREGRNRKGFERKGTPNLRAIFFTDRATQNKVKAIWSEWFWECG
jgi:hypothetical protein